MAGRSDGIVALTPLEPRLMGQNTEDSVLDAINLRLIGELQADARLSLAELGRRVGLSAPAVTDRLQRLRDAGVIIGYRTEVDPRALGFALSVVLRVRPGPRQLAK